MVIMPLQASQNHGPSCSLVPAGLGGAVFVVAVLATVAEYHGGQIIILPALCTWMVILWRHGPSKQGSFTPMKGSPQTKGPTGDPFSPYPWPSLLDKATLHPY